MKHLLCACTLIVGLTLSGCGEGEYPYNLLFFSAPISPVPLQPVTLNLEVQNETGVSIVGGSVTVTGRRAGLQTTAVTLPEVSDGEYELDRWIFPTPGTWTLEFAVNSPWGPGGGNIKVHVSCDGGGGLGAQCCEDTNCDATLQCVYGQCLEGAASPGEGCYSAKECMSGICKDNGCATPNCMDSVLNGTESDVDCGGTCSLCPVSAACQSGSDCSSGVCEEGLCLQPPAPGLGIAGGSPDSVKWTVVLSGQGLDRPTDLAFNPDVSGELWVTSANNDSLTIIRNAGNTNQTTFNYVDYARHFLEEVNAISFGDSGTFATCQDSRNTFDGWAFADDFMGPTMWPSDLADFAIYGPDAAMVHLDMLHEAPGCTGIAAAGENRYFMFGGHYGVLSWVDFREPHQDMRYGGEDHADGLKRHYVDIPLTRRAQTPSHMVVDPATGLLYVADSGTGRVLRISVASAQPAGQMPTWPDDGTLTRYTGGTTEVVAGPSEGLQAPSGVALHEDILYVTDNGTGVISAFDMDGALVNQVDSGMGSGRLAGIEVDEEGVVYLVDMVQHRVLRIDVPLP